MEGGFSRYISSPLFTFQVGPDRKEITVHSGAFASLSPALDTLMNGEMKEAKTRRVDWSEINEGTFTRLCEYAYMRDYTPPSPITMDDGDDKSETVQVKIEPEEYEQALLDDYPAAFHGHELLFTEKMIWSDDFLDKVCDQLRDADIDHLVYYDQVPACRFSGRSNTSPSQDFTPVFLGHAQLYVIADQYGIDTLKALILRKLDLTLRNFTLCPQNVGSIIEFVRFTYANTPFFINSRDPLRDLAVRYISTIIHQIGALDVFHELLREVGDFAVDVWKLHYG